MGTVVEFVDGRFTGEIIGQLNVGQAKVDRLQQVGRLVAAYGDTVRDIPMLSLAETAVAVHPDPRLPNSAAGVSSTTNICHSRESRNPLIEHFMDARLRRHDRQG
jgi:phosphoserine phosphatase